jgi:hypothetical protein
MMFSLYLKEAEKIDRQMIEDWKGTTDGILIFVRGSFLILLTVAEAHFVQAGLFSAVITAFLIESYKGLSEATDTDSATVVLLTQISAQLAGMTNSSQLSSAQPVPSRNAFSPSASSLAVNAMWFLSLSLSLACALAATLVQHWARNYSRSVERFQQSPYRRGLIRALMFEGLEKSHLGEIVELIPILIHLALFLFLAGLVTFLHNISLPIAYLVLSILVACSVLYGVATLSPLFYPESALHTPLSSTLWYALRYVFKIDIRPMYSISDVQARLATAEHSFQQPRQQDRVACAIHWTQVLANEPHEFGDFLIAIPGFISWQRSLFTRYSSRYGSFLLLCSGMFLQTLVTHPSFGTAVRLPRRAQCLQGIYCLAAHRLSEFSGASMDIFRTLAIYLSSCESSILSLVVCTMYASITDRTPTITKPHEDPSLAAYTTPSSPDSDTLLLPIDPSDIRHSIDQMLEFKLGPSPQQALDSAHPGHTFRPFEFIIRKTLPAHDQRLRTTYTRFQALPKHDSLRILIEAIWEAAEGSQGEESFQQISYVNFLNNLLSAYSYFEHDHRHPGLLVWGSSFQTLLPMLLEATGYLDDLVAIPHAMSLLSKYSQADPDRYFGVREAETSLKSLRDKLPPRNDKDTDEKEPHMTCGSELSQHIGPGGSVHRYDPPSPQLQSSSSIFGVQDHRLYDFHTDWFDTHTFLKVSNRGNLSS